MREAAVEDFNATFEQATYIPYTYIVKLDHKIISTLQIYKIPIHPRMAGICWVCVHPDYRKYGLGKKIMDYAEHDIENHVWNGNKGTFIGIPTITEKYYSRMGYSCTKEMTYDSFPMAVKHSKACNE